MSEKSLLLVIGAQKAGTSWLHNFLRKLDDVSLCPIKELHHFDAMFFPKLSGNFHDRFEKQITNKDNLPKFDNKNNVKLRGNRRAAIMMRCATRFSENVYFDYFKNLSDQTGSTIVGEATPAYSMLEAEHFAYINDQCRQRDLPLKVVFLARDPIDRYFSQLRMAERDGENFSAQEKFFASLNQVQFRLRSDYKRVYDNLAASLDPSQIYYGLYENMTETDEVNRLCDFLNVEPKYSKDFSKKVNISPTQDLSDEQIRFARDALNSSYEASLEIFGDTLPEHWKYFNV